MVITLRDDGAVVLDAPDDFRRFSVSVPGGAVIAATALAAIMRADGDTHAWIAPDAVAGLLGGEPEAEWRAGFSAMVGYAAGKGWTDGEGRLRAHVERR